MCVVYMRGVGLDVEVGRILNNNSVKGAGLGLEEQKIL